jgi:hypothetical protein
MDNGTIPLNVPSRPQSAELVEWNVYWRHEADLLTNECTRSIADISDCPLCELEWTPITDDGSMNMTRIDDRVNRGSYWIQMTESIGFVIDTSDWLGVLCGMAAQL